MRNQESTQKVRASILKNRSWLSIFVLAALVALLASYGALTSSADSGLLSPPGATTVQTEGTTGVTMDSLVSLENTLESIYNRVNPSVVHIQVVQKQANPFAELTSNSDVPQDLYRRGSGSGFVWDNQGHIVTNNHVVDSADKISVTFYDGTTVVAEVLGTDPDSDLAVIQVDAPGTQLTPVEMADSAQVKVGQLAIAIGNPYGLDGTMTVGFVSSLGRLLPVDNNASMGTYSIPDVIQTDASINPGNSGGVLIDDAGQVIGVPSAIISPNGVSAGIGFAIPASIVQKTVPVLINTGHYEHSWLGISGTSLSPELAQAAGLESDQRGALVVDVVPDGPADKANLHGSDRNVDVDGQQLRVGGDVIVAIDGQPVKEFDDIVTYLARSTEVGQQVDLTVLRQGKQQDVQVTLAARPGVDEQPAAEVQPTSGGTWLGISGQTLEPALAQAMDLPEGQKGVLVREVDVNSPADEAGLHGCYKPTTINGERMLVGGDVIIAVDGQTVSRMNELQEALAAREPGQEVALTILRGGQQLKVDVTLGERQ